jgi:ferritin-like metal-binding protein YciE
VVSISRSLGESVVTSPQATFVRQVSELRSAETQLIDALPRVAPRAASSGLAQLLIGDYTATRRHRSRLDAVISLVPIDVPDRDCVGMRELIVELDVVVAQLARRAAGDADLFRAVQRVKELEIESYERACTLADELRLGDAARSLARTLHEERETDRRLAEIAGRVVRARLRTRMPGRL